MKILMVNKYLYPRAGAETYMLYVAKELIRAGHQVAFFGMDHPENTKLGPCATFPLLEFGRNQSAVQKVAQLGAAARQRMSGLVSKAFKQMVVEFQPDLIHAHNVYNQMSPSLFNSVIDRIPVVLTVHDFKPICPNYSLFRDGNTCTLCIKGSSMNCLLYRCAQQSLSASFLAATSAAMHRAQHTYRDGYSRYIAPSNFMRDRLAEGGLPKERTDVLNNFAAPPAKSTVPGNGFLFAGRLCEEKGVHTLIDAYAMLPTPRPPLTIAGTGPLEEQLKARALKMGCTEINWLGRVPPDQVETLLEAAAVSIVPSLWFENCSIAIMESLAFGRPCIVSDSGGNPELIRHEQDGWIFRAGDASDLSNCLQRAGACSAETLKTMGVAASEIARERFSPSVHLKQLLTIYDRVVR